MFFGFTRLRTGALILGILVRVITRTRLVLRVSILLLVLRIATALPIIDDFLKTGEIAKGDLYLEVARRFIIRALMRQRLNRCASKTLIILCRR